jgi:hypothetical protein
MQEALDLNLHTFLRGLADAKILEKIEENLIDENFEFFFKKPNEKKQANSENLGEQALAMKTRFDEELQQKEE